MTWRESMPGLSTFKATLRRTGFCCSAMKTTPKPPSPIRSNSLYGPMTVPTCSQIGPSRGMSKQADGSSRKLAGASWARSSASTRCRSSASVPHSCSSNTARAVGVLASTAARNRDCTRWALRIMVGPSKGSLIYATFASEVVEKIQKLLSAQSVAEPGAGVGPFLPRLVDRDAENVRHLRVAQPGAVMQFDDARGDGLLGGQSLQCLV